MSQRDKASRNAHPPPDEPQRLRTETVAAMRLEVTG